MIYMAEQPKQYKTVEELIEILKERGCIISDVSFARETLSKINYYRLTAYLLPFKDNGSKEERYLPNTTFEKIVSLHEFDRKLRSLLLQAIDCIEVTLRARLARTHVKNHHCDPIAYIPPTESLHFKKKAHEEDFSKKIAAIKSNNSDNLIIKHHENKYGGKLPLWVIIEFFTLGYLSRFYSYLTIEDKNEIAKQFIHEYIYEDSRHKFLKSWLHCCTILRNSCAHFEVLYNKSFSYVPKGFNENEKVSTSLWAFVLIIKWLHPYPDQWHKEFMPQLKSLISNYLEDSDLERLSFPKNWKEKLEEKSQKSSFKENLLIHKKRDI